LPVVQEAGSADALEDRGRRRHLALGRRVGPGVVRRPLRRVDGDVGTEALGEREPLVVEVGDDDGVDAAGRERGDGREPDCTGADDEGDLTGDDARERYVSLADCERVRQGNCICVGVGRYHPGERLADEEELTEAARRVGVLADHLHAPGPEKSRDARDPSADRELVRTSSTVADNLADELMTHHDVTVSIPDEHPRRVVRVRMVHVVNVRGTDRGAHRSQQQLTRARYGVFRLADLEASTTQHRRAHLASPSRIAQRVSTRRHRMTAVLGHR
jgi:hypothetical protein